MRPFSFERELKNKLSEKTRGAQSEEAVLMKSFKYFDLNDNGVVEPDEFAKAIEKIGIMIPTKQVSIANTRTSLCAWSNGERAKDVVSKDACHFKCLLQARAFHHTFNLQLIFKSIDDLLLTICFSL